MPNQENQERRPWLKSYDPKVPPTIEYEKMPIQDWLDRTARDNPKRTAVIFRNWRINYAGLKKTADQLAANLQAHGLAPGDRVAIMLPNLPQTIISFWGALKAGAVLVMTNPLYMESELIHQMRDSGARFMIVLDHLWPKIEPLRDRLGVEKYFVTRISDCLGFPLNLLYRFKAKREKLNRAIPFDGKTIIPWKELLKSGRAEYSEPDTDSSDAALLQYTGGTTGVSKGVMLTHENLGVNLQQCRAMLHGIGEHPEIFLGLLPYFHVYGLTVCLTFATSIGATLIPFPRYQPLDVLTAIDKLKPTVFPGAPSVYISLMNQKTVGDFDLSSINYCVSGSAPMPLEEMKRFKELTGAEIIEGYGLTEASPVTHLNPLFGKRKPGSIGLPFPDTDARIVDMVVGGPPLPPGKIGELVIKGPQVMRGYWNRPDETASALRNGWLYTGDIAFMDQEGYFTIVDRKKDMILSGGFNVYPREIDEVLIQHPKVAEGVAVGAPHPTRGEIIKAYVVLKPGEKLSKAELNAFLRSKLANYKVPKIIEFRDGLPKSIVGKVLRRVLRDEELSNQKQEKGAKE